MHSELVDTNWGCWEIDQLIFCIFRFSVRKDISFLRLPESSTLGALCPTSQHILSRLTLRVASFVEPELRVASYV